MKLLTRINNALLAKFFIGDQQKCQDAVDKEKCEGAVVRALILSVSVQKDSSQDTAYY